MAKRPWLESTATLSLYFGGRNPGDSTSAIGWAVLENDPTAIASSGEMMIRSDPNAEAVAQWIRHGRPSPVAVYRYDEKTFPDSVPASEGMTLEQHNIAAEELKAALEDAGATVIFQWHYPMKDHRTHRFSLR
ncbi:hypothetical protein C7441_114126 [Pseudaminobacter salicylatoxidans]|uniref:Uncharacterized protein n=1 Tax=Pseudaminobacter salicylatoxidans TaxID=93369 RepID=A0A316BYV4_PSESE|nr:hypothetical protein [Pseudaminobacter salicylatoxidans]PWJ79848.1 hypothetical protein C7441_114126 [Pseudaminobacter salicylatoxidans]